MIRAHSPVDLLVTDANGHKVGFDASIKRVVADIPGAAYMGHGSEPQTVMIENPAQSSYDIKAIGTGSGSYTIDAETIDGAGNVIKSVQFQGTAAPGSEQTQQVNLAPGGNLGTGGDTTPPTTTTALSPLPNAAGWNKNDVTVMLAATDNHGGSGVRDIRFSLSGAQGGSRVVAGGVARVIITAEGTTTLTYFATDNAGNAEASKTQSVRIDKTPPTISGLPAPGCTIWPPDHSLVRVATVTAADELSGLAPGSPTVTGTSDESPLRPGSGQTSADIVITGTTIELRAERSGTGNGRVYTLTTTASDVAGNSTTATAVCTVPHDQG